MVRRIDVAAKGVYWSEGGSLVAIASDASFYLLEYQRDVAENFLASGQVRSAQCLCAREPVLALLYQHDLGEDFLTSGQARVLRPLAALAAPAASAAPLLAHAHGCTPLPASLDSGQDPLQCSNVALLRHAGPALCFLATLHTPPPGHPSRPCLTVTPALSFVRTGGGGGRH